jgi:hypothetical protein
MRALLRPSYCPQRRRHCPDLAPISSGPTANHRHSAQPDACSNHPLPCLARTAKSAAPLFHPLESLIRQNCFLLGEVGLRKYKRHCQQEEQGSVKSNIECNSVHGRDSCIDAIPNTSGRCQTVPSPSLSCFERIVYPERTHCSPSCAHDSQDPVYPTLKPQGIVW